MSIEENIVLLVKDLGLGEDIPICIDSKLSEIGLNSLTFIKLVVSIEETFGMTFEDEKLNISQYQTLYDIAEYVSTTLD